MNEVDLADMKADVKAIRHLLVGNGQVGLCEQMRDAMQQIGVIEQRSNKRWNAILMCFAGGFTVMLFHLSGGNLANVPGVVLKILAGI